MVMSIMIRTRMETDYMNKELRDSALEAVRDHLLTARNYKGNKQFDDAIHAFSQAWEIAKNNRLFDEMQEMIPSFASAYYESNRFEDAIEFHYEVLQFAIEQEDVSLQARMYTGLGALHWQLREFEKSYEVLLKGKEACEATNDDEMLLNVLSNLALVQASINNYEQSLAYYRQAFALAEKLDDPDIIMTACLNLQGLYYNMGDYKRSRDFGEKGLKIARKEKNETAISGFVNNMGNIHTKLGEHEDALMCYQEALALLDERYSKKNWLANSYLNVGLALVNLKRHDEGEPYLLKAIQISKLEPKLCQESLARAEGNLTDIFIHRNQYDEAEKILEKLIPNLDNLDLGKNRLHFMRSYAEILLKQKKYDKAFEIYNLALDKTIEQYDEKLAEELAKTQILFDHDIKVREANLLRQKNMELEKKNNELEEALESLNKAHETIRELERRNTIYAMSVTTNHELSQPLMIIRGNLDMLINSDALDPKKQHHYIKRISEGIERIEKILLKYRTAERSTMDHYSENTPMVKFEEP